MRAITATLVAGALAAGALAGCGSDDEPATETETVTRPATEPTTGTEPSTRPSRPRPESEPPGRTVRLEQFRTPSGNIGCVLVGGGARCDVRERSWSPPPKPASCELDWGQGLSLDASGPAEVVCAGDTALDPSAPVLAYGETSEVGPLSCTSSEAGVTCRSRDSGRSFFLSRERYELR